VTENLDKEIRDEVIRIWDEAESDAEADGTELGYLKANLEGKWPESEVTQRAWVKEFEEQWAQKAAGIFES